MACEPSRRRNGSSRPSSHVAAAKARTAVAKQSCADKLQVVHAHGCGATLGRLTGDECRRLCSGLVKPNIRGV